MNGDKRRLRRGPHRRSCSQSYLSRSGVSRSCKRKPLWLITYIGPFCNAHFEGYITTHTVDPADIRRLSDNEGDFIVRAEPGQGYGRSTQARESVQAVEDRLEPSLDPGLVQEQLP